MKPIYIYDNHSWSGTLSLFDHERSDIETFCTECEEWDPLIGVVNSKEELIKLCNSIGDCLDPSLEELLKSYDKITSENHVPYSVSKDNMQVGLFFYITDKHIDGKFAFYGCRLIKAESYGDFFVYPKGHDEIWNKVVKYLNFNQNIKQDVDYDYYPRGRVVYRKSDDTFVIYYDKCLEKEIHRLTDVYKGQKVLLSLDEHYCCHECNPMYVI